MFWSWSRVTVGARLMDVFRGEPSPIPTGTPNSWKPVRTTGFQLFGVPVGIGEGSPLKTSISRAPTVTLDHDQNIFSIEFSALSFVNPTTNRYRFRLEGLRP